MKYATFFLFALLLPVWATAQFGVTGFYNVNEATIPLRGSSIDLPYDNGYEVALNYWFRLPKKRVEFLPTVYHARSPGEGLDWSETGFQFKTNFYLLDFGTDCDCPTFGKQGPQLQKGFFLQLSPGVAYHQYTIDNALLSDSDGKVAFNVGGGVGLDIGLSNLITLTPLASIRYAVTDFNPLQYTDENNNVVGEVGDSRLLTTQLGLQLTFRLDKKRY